MFVQATNIKKNKEYVPQGMKISYGIIRHTLSLCKRCDKGNGE